MSDDEFCEHCDVHLSLHCYSDPDEERPSWDCENAAAKAALMERFYGFAAGR